MQVLDMMYSDPNFLNMLDWGLEGVHYKLKEGSDRIITFADGVDASTSGYFHNWSFAFGDQLIAYFWDGTEEDFPEQVRAMNESAMLSKAMGFAYDVTPVKTEYTAVTNVCDQYLSALAYGCIDIDAICPSSSRNWRAPDCRRSSMKRLPSSLTGKREWRFLTVKYREPAHET